MTMLSVESLDVRYGQLRAVRGLTLGVERGEILALVGANGAGKSTLLRAIAGAHAPTSGRIRFNGKDITRMPSHARVAAGIALVPEGRRLFRDMTVEENLLLGRITGRPGSWTIGRVFEVFPHLAKRRHAPAENLSGGEQQATAIGRALMSNPDIVLFDEISLGLSPSAVDSVYASLRDLMTSGATIILVEQDLTRVMRVANRIVCMLEGEMVLDRPVAAVTRAEITAAYFGAHRRARRPEA
jgi:branched-chain amino acid transport system ATP-binding protein